MALSSYTGGFSLSDPFFDQVERAMQRSLDRSFGLPGFGPLVPTGTSRGRDLPFRSVAGTTPMDLIEKDNEYNVIADAPGMHPEDVTVEVHDHVLTIKGQHQETKEDKDQQGRVVRSERVMRSFNRSFYLPEDATSDDIKAHLDKGVLKVVVPKVPAPEKPAPKRIAVQSAASVEAAPAAAQQGQAQ